MPSPFSLTLGPFDRGMNNMTAPALLGSRGAVEATGLDLNAGTLRGMWGLAASVTQRAYPLKFAHWAGNAAWFSSTFVDWATDGPPLTVDNISYEQTFRTAFASAGTTSASVTYPRVHLGANNYQIGLFQNQDSSVTDGAGGGNRTYAVTYYSPTTGWESNPSVAFREDWVGQCQGAVVSLMTYLTYVGTRDGHTIHRRIYATRENDRNGLLYYYDTVTNDTATSYTDNGGAAGDYSVDDTRPLNWGQGGSINEDTTPYDHSMAPKFTVIAMGLHSVDDSEGSGVLFAAQDNTVYWSHAGKYAYWPGIQSHTLPEPVQAIISTGPQTYVFTENGIWSFSGAADYAIAPVTTASPFGVLKGFGKTVVQAPLGILFMSRQGLTLFDGYTSRPLSEGLLDPATFNSSSYTYATAAFWDGFYFFSLWGEEAIWVFDLRDPGKLRISKDTLDVGCFFTTTKTGGAGMTKASLYVLDRGDGNVYPWQPADGDQGGAIARRPWSYKTGQENMGQPTRRKRWLRYWLEASGAVSVKFYADGTLVWTTTESRGRLPASCQGRSLQVEIASSDGTGEVEALRIDGVLHDGAGR